MSRTHLTITIISYISEKVNNFIRFLWLNTRVKQGCLFGCIARDSPTMFPFVCSRDRFRCTPGKGHNRAAASIRHIVEYLLHMADLSQ